jgi:tetratricopeptide (TPR) repeat protein
MSKLIEAIAQVEKGDLSAATAICREALQRGESPEAYGLLAEISRRGGDFAGMIGYARKASDLAPRFAEYRYFHGLALLETGAIDEAIEVLDRAIDLRLTHEPAQAALGAALSRRARFEERYLVSVVTPSIGSDKLARAIESVQAQSYSRLEIGRASCRERV